MKIALLVMVFSVRAWAVERNCGPGEQWSISAGACVKKKAAPKLSPQAKYNQASELLDKRGDAKRAVPLLEQACEAKHGESCTLLGFLYARGRHGLVHDDAKAMSFFQAACAVDDLDGCFDIGDLGWRTGDYAAARAAFGKACDLGSGVACLRAGDLGDRGIGGAADPGESKKRYDKALSLLTAACAADGNACFALGMMEEDGKGVTADKPGAIAHYKRACDAGSGEACLRLGAVLDDAAAANAALDRGCTKYDSAEACQKLGEKLSRAKQDLPRALSLAKRGCELDPRQCGTLAELYRLGIGTPQDDAAATRYYRAACEEGGGWCDVFARRAHDGTGMTADGAAAQAALERGCSGGWGASCYLGASYLTVAKTDDAHAMELARRGCAAQSGNACYLAGWLLSKGRGAVAAPGTPMYERGCALGSPLACKFLGDELRKTDAARSRTLYEQACQGQDELLAAACREWGLMAYAGDGGAKDAALALTALTRACKFREPDTCNFLGTLVIETKGDRAAVLALLKDTCTAGFEQACTAHGNLLAASDSEADHHAAYEGFAASCARKSDDACLRQADMLADGWGVTPDAAAAEAMYRARCDAGRAAACSGMARLYDRQGKLDEALRLAHRACDGGWSDACNSVGYAYYTAHGVRWDVAAAAKWFARACELGNPVGCANSGDVYRYGAGAKQDHAKAFALYEQACRPGEPTGCAGFAHYLATGEGGAKIDRARAAEVLRLACDNDVYVMPEACRALAELAKGGPAEVARLRTTAFTRATELAKDNPYYMYLLGTYHAEGMATIRDPATALVWFAKACDGFDPLGCVAAGRALRATKKPADDERARVYFERACAAGVDDGCAGLQAPKPPAVTARGHGCGCSGDVAPGAQLGLAVIVLACVARPRRGRPRRARQDRCR